jgi:hypothetical protein
MKTKLILLIGLVAITGATVIVLRRGRPAPRDMESQMPQVMSNYQKTFKLDTSPALFPDGKTGSSQAKTNSAKP